MFTAFLGFDSVSVFSQSALFAADTGVAIRRADVVAVGCIRVGRSRRRGVAHDAVHPEQLRRRRRKALVAARLRRGRPDHRARRRGRLSGRAAPRRHALRPVALAVQRAQGAPGDHPARQDRLRLCPRRPAAAAEPDARPRRAVQQLPGRPGVPEPRATWTTASSLRGQRGRQRAILREGVYAINSALFVVITDDAVYTLRAAADASRSWRRSRRGSEELHEIDGFDPVVIGRPIEALDPLDHHVKRSRSTASASSRCTTARRWRRARSSPRRSAADAGVAELPQQLPGPRGVPVVPAAAAAGSCSR